jgi:uroporphyrinogen-III decarboxylase
MVLQTNQYTSWVTEPLVKEKSDVDVIAAYVTTPLCDVQEVNREAERYGEHALIRGHIPAFDVFGQPGCWQDACCLFGTERMIMESFDDPPWVHHFLGVLQARKLGYIASMKGARFDLNELGGGDASSTVISPRVFAEFVAPYDSRVIEAAHAAGQRIVYHTCGGMMPILDDIAAMKPDAMETFTPSSMGGDVILAEAKKRIGDKVCMIGGFDQGYYFSRATVEEVRTMVRKCFADAGEGGGYILAPSDHFFDSDPVLISAFADEARRCVYT